MKQYDGRTVEKKLDPEALLEYPISLAQYKYALQKKLNRAKLNEINS